MEEKGIKASVVDVTPEMAKEWLSHNCKNRKINMNIVAKYANDMKNGNWELNGESIAFNQDGTLINGQHRLKAVIVSDTVVPMMVVTGLDNATALFDRGRNRRTSDYLVMNAELPAILTRRNSVSAINMHVDAFKGRYAKSDAEIKQVIKKHEDGLTKACEICYKSKKGAVRSDTAINVLATMYAIEAGVSPDELAEFWKIFESGINYDKERNAPIILRNDYINIKNYSCKYKKGEWPEKRLYAIERAIYDFVHHTERKVTYFHTDINKRIYSKMYEDIKNNTAAFPLELL